MPQSWCRIAPWAIAALILLAPLVVMRYTEEVDWDEADFAAMGAMLLSACTALELAVRARHGGAHRAGVAVAVVAAFALVWLNLAVGIVGPEAHPANRMYAAAWLFRRAARAAVAGPHATDPRPASGVRR